MFRRHGMDGRVKRGHDEEGRGWGFSFAQP
jgi:hypothetical protein